MGHVLRGRRDFYLLASRSRMSPATAAARDWLLVQADP
jgi:LysR family glycine cleavage system transcriptional activator